MTDTPSSHSRRSSLDIAVPAHLDGRVVLPGDERYEAARLVDNAAIERRPAAIVLARDVADIVATLRLADDSGLPLAVRAGATARSGTAPRTMRSCSTSRAWATSRSTPRPAPHGQGPA